MRMRRIIIGVLALIVLLAGAGGLAVAGVLPGFGDDDEPVVGRAAFDDWKITVTNARVTRTIPYLLTEKPAKGVYIAAEMTIKHGSGDEEDFPYDTFVLREGESGPTYPLQEVRVAAYSLNGDREAVNVDYQSGEHRNVAVIFDVPVTASALQLTMTDDQWAIDLGIPTGTLAQRATPYPSSTRPRHVGESVWAATRFFTVTSVRLAKTIPADIGEYKPSLGAYLILNIEPASDAESFPSDTLSVVDQSGTVYRQDGAAQGWLRSQRKLESVATRTPLSRPPGPIVVFDVPAGATGLRLVPEGSERPWEIDLSKNVTGTPTIGGTPIASTADIHTVAVGESIPGDGWDLVVTKVETTTSIPSRRAPDGVYTADGIYVVVHLQVRVKHASLPLFPYDRLVIRDDGNRGCRYYRGATEAVLAPLGLNNTTLLSEEQTTDIAIVFDVPATMAHPVLGPTTGYPWQLPLDISGGAETAGGKVSTDCYGFDN